MRKVPNKINIEEIRNGFLPWKSPISEPIRSMTIIILSVIIKLKLVIKFIFIQIVPNFSRCYLKTTIYFSRKVVNGFMTISANWKNVLQTYTTNCFPVFPMMKLQIITTSTNITRFPKGTRTFSSFFFNLCPKRRFEIFRIRLISVISKDFVSLGKDESIVIHKLCEDKTLLKETKKTKEGAERKEKREGNSKRKSNTRPIMFREKGLINKTPSPSGYLAVTSLVKMLQGLGGKYLLTFRSILFPQNKSSPVIHQLSTLL